LKDNSYTSADIVLQVYRGGVWKTLKTSAAGGDETSEFFTADTQGFSTFAIIAKHGAEQKLSTLTAAPAETTETKTPVQPLVTQSSHPVTSSRRKKILLVTLLVVVVFAVIFYFIRKKKQKPSFSAEPFHKTRTHHKYIKKFFKNNKLEI